MGNFLKFDSMGEIANMNEGSEQFSDGSLFLAENSSNALWDYVVGYHDFRDKLTEQRQKLKLQKLVVSELIRKAQSFVGAILHREKQVLLSGQDIEGTLKRIEFDFEETLEYSGTEYLFKKFLQGDDIYYSAVKDEHQPIILCVDTSLSMTGTKLALTAMAIAIVLMHFKENPISLVVFENEARVLVEPTEKLPIEEWVKRFLEVPASGYTHLEKGMQLALKKSYEMKRLLVGGQQKDPAVILLTDGKYTAGRDPTFLAKKFKKLHVMQMGVEHGGDALCKNMAKFGKGSLYRVAHLELLPKVMYYAVKDILRGAR